MSRASYEVILLVTIGAFFSIHCFRAGRRELLEGRARGIWADYPRGSWGFWPTIAMTFGASAMGAIFLIYGVILGTAILMGK